MELLMQEFHMYLLDIKSIPKLNGQHDNRDMSSIRLNLLTKTTWKLKTPGGILVFRLLVQVWDKTASGTGRSNKKDILHSRSAPPFSMGQDCLWNRKKHNVGDLNPHVQWDLHEDKLDKGLDI